MPATHGMLTCTALHLPLLSTPSSHSHHSLPHHSPPITPLPSPSTPITLHPIIPLPSLPSHHPHPSLHSHHAPPHHPTPITLHPIAPLPSPLHTTTITFSSAFLINKVSSLCAIPNCEYIRKCGCNHFGNWLRLSAWQNLNRHTSRSQEVIKTLHH